MKLPFPIQALAGTRLRAAAAVAAGAILSLPGSLAAQTILFQDNFDTDSSANWSIFEGSGDATPDFSVDWAFDYGAVNYTSGGVTAPIPPSPNGNGTTKAVKLTVNNNDETAASSAVSLYPTGQTFMGDFAVKFDLWMNYNGGAYGGTGSTEHAAFGINHLGTQVNWADATFLSDGIWFGVAGEAGTGTAAGDYSAYVGDGVGGRIRLVGIDGGYVYAEEVNPNQPPEHPLKQIFASPDFESAGAPGKGWVEVEIRQRTVDGVQVVTWLMNGYVIAEHTQGALFGLVSGNLMLGYMDLFASIANPRADNFVLYDNLRVEDLTGVPAKPVVALVPNGFEVSEPNLGTTATVSRTGDLSQPLTVNLRTRGTATSDVDYVAIPAAVTIPAGETTATFDITPKDDDAGEPTETILVTIVGSDDYEVREALGANLQLLDDGDVPAASVAVRKPVAYERNPGRVAEFTVSFGSAGFADVTVNYTLGGSAVNGTDYETVAGSVTIPAGETAARVTIVPKDNALTDGPRNVTLTLAEGPGYKLGAATSGEVSIRDDDFLTPGTLAYTETFDTDATANWTVNGGPTDETADFFFDYSTVGVPPAPGVASTRGLKLQANLLDGIFGGFSVSPVGKSFEGDFRLRFDLWQSFNGPLPGGGNGSTQLSGAGVGTAGTTPQWPGGTQDSVWFAATADGGSSVDYRAYSPAAPTGHTDDSGVFAAGTTGGPRNEANPYYAEFGRESAPQAQLDLFPDQAGETFVGAQGFQWRDVVIEKRGTQVSWWIDGLRIATVDASAITFGGGNILFNYSDINAGLSTDPDSPFVAFGLFDNVRVETLATSVEEIELAAPAIEGTDLVLSWTGGTGTFVVQGKLNLNDAAWIDLKTTTARTAKIPLASPLGFFRVQDGSGKTVKLYQASLDAAQENNNVTSPATGLGLLAVDGTTATYVVSYQGLVGTLNNAHVHGPAAAGVNAGVLFGINFAPVAGTRAGVISGQATIDATAAGHIEAGNTYFNLHTSSFGGGEIRGQILAAP